MAPEEQLEYVVTVIENGKQVINGLYTDRRHAYAEWSDLNHYGFRAQLWEIPAGLREYLREQG